MPVWQEMFYQQPPPLPATALPSPPPRPGPRRRRWTLVLTGVLSAGLAAGLVYWAPWHNPPAAPGAVVVTSGTATSALVSWARSTGGGAPDHYLVLRDGQQVGSVPATQTSFTDNGLAPGSRHQYVIVAAAGGDRSGPSVKASVLTLTPSPVGLGVTKATWGTATIRWSPSPLGPQPDTYEIRNGASIVGTVSGSITSYDITQLTPGASAAIQVTARWGKAVSAPASLSVSPLDLPLAGDVSVTVNTTSTPGGGASLHDGEQWTDSWHFTANCAATSCTLTTSAGINAPDFAAAPFTMTLTSSGFGYAGTAKAHFSRCSTTDVTNTVKLTIIPKTVNNGAWSAWHGTMVVSAPYVDLGSSYCPEQSWTFSVTHS